MSGPVLMSSMGTQGFGGKSGMAYDQVSTNLITIVAQEEVEKEDPAAGSDLRCRLCTFLFLLCPLVAAVVMFTHFWFEAGSFDTSLAQFDSHTMTAVCFYSLVGLVLMSMSSFMCFGGYFGFGDGGAQESRCRWTILGLAFVFAMADVGLFDMYWTKIAGEAAAFQSESLSWPYEYKSEEDRALSKPEMRELKLKYDIDKDGNLDFAEFKALSDEAEAMTRTHALSLDEMEDKKRHQRDREHLEAVFSLLDEDRSGHLEAQEEMKLDELGEGGQVKGKPLYSLRRPREMMGIAFYIVVFILFLNMVIVCSFWSGSGATRSVVFATADSKRWGICCTLTFILLAGAGAMIFFSLMPGKPPSNSDLKAEPKTYECDEDLYDWKNAWSDAKKKWCCYHHDKGCPTKVVYDTRFIQAPAPPPVIRYVKGHEEAPPPEVVIHKKLLPVKRRPEVHYHKEYVYDIPTPREVIHKTRIIDVPAPAPPPEVKIRHRIKTVKVPAPPPPPQKIFKYRYRTVDAPPPDCDAGSVRDWDGDKREYCCKHEDKACYDCDSGYADWEMDWSFEKQRWCCQHNSKGCPK